MRYVKGSLLNCAAAVQSWCIERKETGATAVEYALLLGLLAIAIIGAVVVFGSRVETMFHGYANTIPS